MAGGPCLLSKCRNSRTWIGVAQSRGYHHTPLCGGDIGHLSAAVRKTRTREPLVWEAAIHSMTRSGLGDLARHARISGAAQNRNSRLLRGGSATALNVRAPLRRRRGKLERLTMPPILGRPRAAWRSGAWERGRSALRTRRSVKLKCGCSGGRRRADVDGRVRLLGWSRYNTMPGAVYIAEPKPRGARVSEVSIAPSLHDHLQRRTFDEMQAYPPHHISIPAGSSPSPCDHLPQLARRSVRNWYAPFSLGSIGC